MKMVVLRKFSMLIAGPILAAGVVFAAAPAGAATGPTPGLPLKSTLISPANAARAAAPQAGVADDALNTDSCTQAAGVPTPPPDCLAAGYAVHPTAVAGIGEFSVGSGWGNTSPLIVPPLRNAVTLPNEVSCVGAKAPVCLLVGEHYTSSKNPAQLAETFSTAKSAQGTWTLVDSFNPPGSTWSALDDVACPTTAFCLAIGVAGTSTGSHSTAYTFTSGTSWLQMAMPVPSGATNSELGGLSCADATDCVAVGNFENSSNQWLSYAAAWNGTSWQLTNTPNISGTSETAFNAVSCPTATLCVADGVSFGANQRAFTEIGSKSGSAWTWQWVRSAATYANTALDSVSCPTATECYASGFAQANALLEQWQAGQGWHLLHAGFTNPKTSDVLAHVSCISTTNCVAAGRRYNPKIKGYSATLIEVWNGHNWQVKSTPNP